MSKWGILEVIIVILVVAASASGYIYIKHFHNGELLLSESVMENFVVSTQSTTTKAKSKDKAQDIKEEPIVATSSPVVSPSSIITLNTAWTVFESLQIALQAKDINAVTALSYEKPLCTTEQSCADMFNFLINYIGKPTQSSFVHIWEDAKQIIISTDPRSSTSGQGKGYVKYYIYFVKTNGTIKFLAVEPKREWKYTTTYTSTSPEQIEKELQALMLDTDKDGLTDMEEICEEINSENSDCKKTNPGKRDTDGDGWWDGIEAKFIAI